MSMNPGTGTGTGASQLLVSPLLRSLHKNGGIGRVLVVQLATGNWPRHAVCDSSSLHRHLQQVRRPIEELDRELQSECIQSLLL